MTSKQEKRKQHPDKSGLFVPDRILQIAELPVKQKMLLARIDSFGTKGCWESNAALAGKLGVSARTISAWVARLMPYLYCAGRNSYWRTLYSKENPKVKAATHLHYRNRLIPKSALESGPDGSTLPRRYLRGDLAKNCAVTSQEPAHSPRKRLPPTIRNTGKETIEDTTAVGVALAPHGPATRLQEARRSGAAESVEKFKALFGRRRQKWKPLSAEEVQKRKQEILASLGVKPEDATSPLV